MKFNFFIFYFFITIVYSCETPRLIQTKNYFYDDLFKKGKYHDNLNNVSRSEKIYYNLDVLYSLNVTYFSPSFEKRFIKRFDKRLKKIDLINKLSNHTVLFISIFSPKKIFSNITKKEVWDISLKVGHKNFFPQNILRVSNKEQWQSAFPYINKWSNEFILYFPKLEDTAYSSPVNLEISSTNATTTMTW